MTWLTTVANWFHGNNRTGRSVKGARRRLGTWLGLEALEDRNLMSADVSATLSNGVLQVTGNNQTPLIDIYQQGQTLTVKEQVFVYTQGPSSVVNGISISSGSISLQTKTVGTFYAGYVQSINLTGGAGSKTIDVEPSVQTQLVTINAGSGNDTLDLIAGRDKIMTATGRDTINVTIDPLRYLNRNAPYALVSAAVQYGGTLPNDTFNVSLNLGSFGNTIVRQGISEVQQGLAFFRPLVNTLNTQIPVISALSQKAGGPAYTWKSVIDTFANRGADQALNTFLNTYNAIENFNPGSFSGSLYLGTFSAPSPTSSHTITWGNPLGQITPSGNNFATTLGRLGVNFDILTDPSQTMKLLLGGTASLISYNSPTLNVQTGSIGDDYQIPVGGIFSVDVGFSGSLSVQGGISLRLDSSGLYYHNVLDGLHITNAYAQLTPSISISGGVAVGVPDVITIGKIYGQATLSGSLRASLSNYSPFYTSTPIGNAISFSGGLYASGGVYVSYSQAITDLGSGNILGAIQSLITQQQHTDQVFATPNYQLYSFGN